LVDEGIEASPSLFDGLSIQQIQNLQNTANAKGSSNPQLHPSSSNQVIPLLQAPTSASDGTKSKYFVSILNYHHN